MSASWLRRARSERGTALLEAAMTLPLLLLLSVGIFEFGRAYETWQVLTNAAREGARIAILPNPASGAVQARVLSYMQSGQLSNANSATVTVTPTTVPIGGGGTAAASQVTVNYPFDFIVLNPVVRLIDSGSGLGSSTLTMTASAVMRNETQ
jgi:Flp pilus assembly protein TadG